MKYSTLPYPFATRRFKSDGKTVLAEIARETGERALLDLVQSQFAFHEVLWPLLDHEVDFSDEGVAERWWPRPGRDVVLDPERSFGQPIVAREGVPTAVLAKAYAVERSFARVAAQYEVSETSVRRAVAFEESLAA